ncbi:nucleotidyl transferase AbiEii/AbiGii toxin family protein [Mycobacterium lacus]|nr:nucleotidyl transferase AbiEii/AbiGii toxin family protein [Mycobacterium lacus]
MSLLREHRDDLRALVGLTADALGIGAVFVEKDFWVTEVLRAATSPVELEARDGSRHLVTTIFKGGTSLSRVHGLIQRFSEDVDLLVGFPPVDASAGAKDRVLKGIRDAVTVHLALDAANVTTEGAPTTGVKRNTRYTYPAIGYEAAGVVSPGVLLEMGCRGGTFPRATHMLRSMVADHAVEVLGESADARDEFAPVHGGPCSRTDSAGKARVVARFCSALARRKGPRTVSSWRATPL